MNSQPHKTPCLADKHVSNWAPFLSGRGGENNTDWLSSQSVKHLNISPHLEKATYNKRI